MPKPKIITTGYSSQLYKKSGKELTKDYKKSMSSSNGLIPDSLKGAKKKLNFTEKKLKRKQSEEHRNREMRYFEESAGRVERVTVRRRYKVWDAEMQKKHGG